MTRDEGPPKPELPFGPQTRIVLSLAEEVARRFWHNYVGSAHLLAALISEGDVYTTRALSASGINLPRVYSVIEHTITRGEQPPPEKPKLGFTQGTQGIIRLAVEEASMDGARNVKSSHLLRGLLRCPDEIAYGILESYGINPSSLYRNLRLKYKFPA